MIALAGIVVVACGLWLVGLAIGVAVAPQRTARFLGAFASSARAHYTEQVLRLAGGAAFVAYAAEMRFSQAFRLFGWVVAVTAAVLLLLPWRWHRRIGERVIPMATRRLKLFGLGALALGAFVLFSVLPVARDSEPAVDLAVVGVSVVDVDGGAVLEKQTLRIHGDRILDVLPTSADAPPSAARCLDGRGLYAIPGLWDMHVHALWDRSVAGDFLSELARHGVTGIRDMGGTLEVLDEIRGAAQPARAGWPRIFAAGSILDGPEPVDPDISIAVGDAGQAVAAVDELAARGVDFIKVYTLLPRDAFFAAVERAGQRGLSVAGHVPAAVTVREAVGAGLASIEHLRDELGGLCHELDPADCAALIGELAAAQVRNTPTLAVLEAKSMPGYRAAGDRGGEAAVPPAARELWEAAASRQSARPPEYFARRREIFRAELALVGRLHRAGVPILAGSDTGSPWIRPGRSLHRELELLVEAGLSPREALYSATLGAAGFLGLEGSIGQLSQGFAADFVLIAGDPLADISNVHRIAAVVLGGRILAPAVGAAVGGVAVAPCRDPRDVP